MDSDDNSEVLGCPHIKNIDTNSVKKALKIHERSLDDCKECTKSISKAQLKKMQSLNPSHNNMWMCLKCGNIGCGSEFSPREGNNPSHAQSHFSSNQKHCMVANLQTGTIYCLECQYPIEVPLEQLKSKDPSDLSYKERTLLECTELFAGLAAKNAAKREPTAPISSTSKPGKGLKEKQQKQQQKNKQVQVKKITVVHVESPTIDVVKSGTEDIVSGGSGSMGICGLRNLGNTCFFNSIMQNLAHTEPFVTAMIGCRETKLDEASGDKKVVFKRTHDIRMGPVTKGFIGILDAMYKHNGSSTYSPTAIFNAISKKYPRYNSYRQQDAHELLMTVLDLISEEQKGDVKGAANTFVEDVFGGLSKSYVRCHTCGNVSVSDEQFVCVSVPIPLKYAGDYLSKGKRRNRNVVADDPSVPKLGKKYTAEELFEPSPKGRYLSKKKMKQLAIQKRKAGLKAKKKENEEKEGETEKKEEENDNEVVVNKGDKNDQVEEKESNTEDVLKEDNNNTETNEIGNDGNEVKDDKENENTLNNKEGILKEENNDNNENKNDNEIKNVQVEEKESNVEEVLKKVNNDNNEIKNDEKEIKSNEENDNNTNNNEEVLKEENNAETSENSGDNNEIMNDQVREKESNTEDVLKEENNDNNENKNDEKDIKSNEENENNMNNEESIKKENNVENIIKDNEKDTKLNETVKNENTLNNEETVKSEEIKNNDESNELTDTKENQTNEKKVNIDEKYESDKIENTIETINSELTQKEDENNIESNETNKSDEENDNSEADIKDKRIGYTDGNRPTTGSGCTLDECLFWHTRQEELTGIDKYFCSKCTAEARKANPSADPVFCDATKQIVFSRLPEVLILHVKRFLQTSSGSLTKIDTFVDIPPTIDMRPYCARGSAPGSTKYALFGVSEHGGGLGGGHYTACVQVPYSGKWYSCSDAHVSSCSASNANNSGAYILFYKRIH